MLKGSGLLVLCAVSGLGCLIAAGVSGAQAEAARQRAAKAKADADAKRAAEEREALIRHGDGLY